jgi:glucose-1-phosphate thymidylyltransferase
MVDMAIAYLITDLPYGVPFTLDSAFPFLEKKRVLFGFPDILIQTDDVYVRLLDRMHVSKADIVLGLFLADNPNKMDMVELADDETIAGIRIKPAQTDLKWTWIIAVWNGAFTRFMHDWVHRHLRVIAASKGGLPKADRKELFVGDVIQEAIGCELKVDQVMFPQGTYIDIGSPEDMIAAIQAGSSIFL